MSQLCNFVCSLHLHTSLAQGEQLAHMTICSYVLPAQPVPSLFEQIVTDQSSAGMSDICHTHLMPAAALWSLSLLLLSYIGPAS